MRPEARLACWSERVGGLLEFLIPPDRQPPERLHAAMRYAALGAGKRMRPLLVYATGHALGASESQLDAAAAAVELVHAYSLIHDDLPAMDDDDLRRGRPTVHIAFDEATAILAGDALQALAFETLTSAPHPADTCLRMLALLGGASGSLGMAGGQAFDLAATGQTIPIDQLERLHQHKTGALIRAAVGMGALAAGVGGEQAGVLDRFAAALGLAFQIRDDVLDVEGDPKVIGKSRGKDAAQRKSTFPALLGLEGSRARLRELSNDMQRLLQDFDERAEPLRHLAVMAVERAR